ncbi:MAG: DUF1275 family protein [Myxococcota bacterium]
MSTLSRGLLAFAAGFVDTATFVHLGGLFAAHVTGNFVVFAAALSRGLVAEDFLKLVTFPVFVIAVLLGAAIHERRRRRDHDHDGARGQGRGKDGDGGHLTILGAEGLLLLGAGGVALTASLRGGSIDLEGLDVAVAMAMVVAMGLQNSVHRIVPGPMTTVMTGNVTQFTTLIGHAVFGRKQAPSKQEPSKAPIRWAPSIALLLGFGLGCLASALSTRALGLCTALAAGVVVSLVVGLEVRRRAHGAS